MENIVTKQTFERGEAGLGDEVVVVGLFRNHYGQAKNIPVIRIGTLAALPEEPVKTRWSGYIEAYLVELHSIGGLSGSPLYLHHPIFRLKDGKVEGTTSPSRLELLGVMQGHFDVPNLKDDSVVDDDDGDNGSINTGIGVVVPAYKILDIMLKTPEMVAKRDAVIARKKQEAATGDKSEKDA